MLINEMFYSIQGEGGLAGMPSFFVRMPGCPLRCKWCDTQYAWDIDAGTEYSIEQIRTEMSGYPSRHLVITGGEPMVNDDIWELVRGFSLENVHVTVETSGIRYISGLGCDLVSISPKLSNSTPEALLLRPEYDKIRFDIESLQSLIEEYDYQLKFVVDAEKDLDEIARCLQKLEGVEPDKVFLMPQARNRTEYVEKSRVVSKFCMETGFAFSPRLQLMLWDDQRGR